MSLVLKNARPPVSSATSLSVSTMVSTVESVVNCCVLAAGGDAKAPDQPARVDWVDGDVGGAQRQQPRVQLRRQRCVIFVNSS